MPEQTQKYLRVKSKLVQLYLRGVRGFFEGIKSNDLRRRNRIILSAGCGLFCYLWIKQNYLTHEFDRRTQSNIFIPKFIYKSRREHYVYWEISRLARGLSTTFTYYDWDPKSEMIFYTDRQGKQTFEKNVFSRERLDIMDNPLFEEIFRYQHDLNKKEKKRANLLIAYQININNRYDLDNYLQHKPITTMDVLRGVFYQFYTVLDFTNRYRYDHFLSKSDFLYEFEKIKLALNPMDRLSSQEQLMIKLKKIKDFYVQYLNQ